MFISLSYGLGEPDTINDRGMIECITNDGILWAKYRLKEASVGIEPAGEQDSIFSFVILRDYFL